MPKNISYNRMFIMLQEENKGYGRGGKPTGYLKIENKEKKVKYQIHLQNIGVAVGNKVLKAYVLSEKSKSTKPYYIGTIELKESSGDLSCEYGREELKTAGIDPEQVDAVIVVCKDVTSEAEYEAVPLIGFKNKPWSWKEAFTSSKAGKIEKAEKEAVTPPVVQTESADEKKNPIGFIWPEGEKGYTDNTGDMLEGVEDNPAQLQNETAVHQTSGNQEEHVSSEAQNSLQEESEQNRTETVRETPLDKGMEEEAFETLQNFQKPYAEYPKDKEVLSKAVRDYLKDKQKADFFNNAGALADWRIVHDLIFIPSILITKCGFQPNGQNDKTAANLMVVNDANVLRAVKRYGHYLVGVQEDRNGNLVNIAFGIPGRFGVEAHPLLYVQGYANWIPHKDYKKMMGAFGYWTIGVDVVSGEFTIIQG